MVELDPLISQYSHLNKYDREADALHALKKIASLVKPLMRARNWKVGLLAEFYPKENNLLGKKSLYHVQYILTAPGVNFNKGMKICLRLRYAGDKNQFLPMEQGEA